MEEKELEKEAEAYADALEIRGCSYWNGLFRGYIDGKKQTETHDVSNVEEDEVTHKNFFGENIKRVSAALSEAGLFGKDNNRFVDIFKKLLKGEASEEEIKFAKKYSAKWQKKQLQK